MPYKAPIYFPRCQNMFSFMETDLKMMKGNFKGSEMENLLIESYSAERLLKNYNTFLSSQKKLFFFFVQLY